MKQTLTQRMPKKLWNHQSVKLSSTVGGQREMLREHHNTINSLIDVVTEQQNRLDRHNDRIAETNKHFSNKLKDLQKEIDELEKQIEYQNSEHIKTYHISPVKSYTAQASTEYCDCGEPSVCGFKKHDGNDICIQCGEYIKPKASTGDVTLCKNCMSITLTINGEFGDYCGNCGAGKPKANTEEVVEAIKRHNKYCTCENANTNYEWCLYCDKPIKQEVEDCKPIVNKKLRHKIAEICYGGKMSNMHEVSHLKDFAYKQADKILKILNK